jgi:hypothetical protein
MKYNLLFGCIFNGFSHNYPFLFTYSKDFLTLKGFINKSIKINEIKYNYSNEGKLSTLIITVNSDQYEFIGYNAERIIKILKIQRL